MRAFKDKTGFVCNGLALSYVLLTYGLGFAGLFSHRLIINGLSVLSLAHGMTIAAYLLHECAHNTIFKKNQHNARLGRCLTWTTGSCYGTYEDIRFKHFRHHVDNGDIVWFEHGKWLACHASVLKLVQLLEWFYIPAHDLMMHTMMVFSAFVIPQRKSQRLRNIIAIIVRGGAYGILLCIYPRVALLYSVAYLQMMIVLRFMDALQHDYSYTPNLFDTRPAALKGDRVYEQAHTFSNPLSLSHVWLNLFVLNFGFHNAHHARPTAPWYRLPAVHRELYGHNPNDVILLWAQIKCYHKYRVARVVSDTAPEDNQEYLQRAQSGRVAGGNAASFLTSF